MTDIPEAAPSPDDVEEALASTNKYADLLISMAYEGMRFHTRVAQIRHLTEIAKVADWYLRTRAAGGIGYGRTQPPVEAAAHVDRLLDIEFENGDNLIEMVRAQQARIRNVQQWLQAAAGVRDVHQQVGEATAQAS